MSNSQERKTLILIADDESLSRRHLTLMLKKDEYEIVGVENGQECLTAYQELHPDMVLLDGLMPIMDGFECCKELKRLPNSEDTPVLMITGLDDKISVNKAYEVGATDFLTKPINPAVLRRRIRYLLDAKKSEKALRESEEKYRSLVENLKEVIFYTNITGKLTFLNPAWKELTGLFPEESLGHNFSEYIYPDDLPLYEKGFQSLVKNQSLTYYLQLRYLKKNGYVGWMEIFASLVKKEEQIIGISGSLNDITERKRIEQYQKIERDVIKILAESENIDEGIQGVIKVIGENLGWEIGEYWSFQENTQSIHFQDSWCIEDSNIQNICQQHQEKLKTMFWNNWEFSSYENWHNNNTILCENLKINNDLQPIFTFPINKGDEHLGVICFFSRQSHHHDSTLLENIVTMGNQIGQFIKRKQAEEELKQRNLLLQSELNIASGYILSLLPSPNEQEFLVEQKFIPSAKLGGDIFDYYWLDEENVVIYLLDVAGHGIHSALLSVSILNLVRNNSLYNTDPYQPWTILTELNRLFQMDNDRVNYFTIWYGVYNKNTRELIYASAGHPPAILISPQGNDWQYHKLSTPNMPIGMLEDIDFDQNLYEVQPNSILYIFSDGIYEIPVGNGEIWGLNNFTDLLLNVQKEQNQDLQKVIDHVHIINKSSNFDDDLSILKITLN
ncbi:serine phosphatase RsbU [Geminocystis sp. NIES-3708]|uniref:SpoIIE family protein phosphatase n=1 Tax=Geminocystis sp. NIES-3708 TaxID=1615909 RepID=UPI0005FC9B76|nr:SpoIIE family protein phosphatase [Geminocystis sp. NIES-3708]BAQ63048.1 serine phosphatase RsbU [Geminocystis sp. NIES-3708]